MVGKVTIKGRVIPPESVSLHVAPSACMRRMAIQAYKDRVEDQFFSLIIGEDDVVSGAYEDIIPDAVEELLERVDKRPRVIKICVNCIDDLLGTDHEALTMLLEQRFPGIKFMTVHIDPIRMSTGVMPGMRIQQAYFDLLDPCDERVNAVNIVGSTDGFLNNSEFFPILSGMGYEVRTLGACKDFDEYLAMAQSKLNVVVSQMAMRAAESMEKRLGIPYLFAPRTYLFDEIDDAYFRIADALGAERPDLAPYRERTQAFVDQARDALNGMPIIVDNSGDPRPLNLGRALVEWGFNVRRVFDGIILECDEPFLQWFRTEHPEIPVEDSRRYSLMNAQNDLGECLSIGFSSGYLFGADHMVDFIQPRPHYGYAGVELLMRKMMRAITTKADYAAIKARREAL